MKLSFFVVMVVSMCACTSHNVSQSQAPKQLDQSYYNPPNTSDLIVGDKKAVERQAALDEEKAYWKSLENITTKIRNEALDIAICKEVEKDSGCTVMLKYYCEVDELVDSRGGHHDKPYCKKQ
jgi:hypothetical protein